MIPSDCKRLIEADLPIATISEHAVDEQNVKKGHLHSIHVWWATRPLATCRAVILASLIPDPVDKACPDSFREKAPEVLDSLRSGNLNDPFRLRQALIDFIGEFSSFESSVDQTAVDKARRLISLSYPEGVPLVVDPFAGIGSIPFEALRLGNDAFAGDLNPVATLLLKTVIEDLPGHDRTLVREFDKWARWTMEKAQKELLPYYPPDSDGSVPLAFMWARTIRCEGPGCGTILPLVGLPWLSKREGIALRYSGDKKHKRVLFEIFKAKSESQLQTPIVNRFTATCPVCGYTTPYDSVGEQLRKKHGGTKDAQMIAVITLRPSGGRGYRLATDRDLECAKLARQTIEKGAAQQERALPLIPNEPTPITRGSGASRAFSLRKYGMDNWGDVFTDRQALTLTTFARLVREANREIIKEKHDSDCARVLATLLAMAVTGTLAPFQSSLSFYSSDHMRSLFMQGMAIPMRPDFAEANPLMPGLVGGSEYAFNRVLEVLERESLQGFRKGVVHQGPATSIPLPDQSVQVVVTDPPYYDAVPYAALSDFCYIWMKRMVKGLYPELFQLALTPKKDEAILDPGTPEPGGAIKDRKFFEDTIRNSLSECKRILSPEGVAVVLFAHKGTAGWEALLKALVDAGWTVTASWPIETERGARMRARNSAVLASSVFLVCRPRTLKGEVGDWREILSQLQPRVHVWMDRLRTEQILGADAIFACLGPALEIYSKYPEVETAGGKRIQLADTYGEEGELVDRGYLSYVWEAVAKEALGTIFKGADLSGFEEDSRLTAMWLWTLRSQANRTESKASEKGKPSEKIRGYSLEYDTARKIAQGLGAHLEDLGRPGGIVEVRGNAATLLFVNERRETLLGKSALEQQKSKNQLTLLGESASELTGSTVEAGRSTLDKLHQAMLLFGDGRTNALRRLLVDEGIGNDARFWRLADALSALYPRNSEEKRWAEGVVSRKKSLGF